MIVIGETLIKNFDYLAEEFQIKIYKHSVTKSKTEIDTVSEASCYH